MAKILETSAAGFIGFHLAQQLLAGEDTVVRLDDSNGYYDVTLKEAGVCCLLPGAGATVSKSLPSDSLCASSS